ncbi:MAG: transcriptional regulator, partial [Acidimicrobiia bacterium]
MSREEAAIAVGISRKLAAFHLEKLLAAGLLEVPLNRVESRSRTSGRAPKLYSTATREFSVAIPVRRYELLGEILLEAMDDSADVDGSAQGAVIAAARRGRAAGEQIREE